MRKKIARTLTAVLPVDASRVGSCNQCGDCCELPFRCTFLRDNAAGESYCMIYKIRPMNCRKFPRTPLQLESVKENCGYSFADKSQKNK